MAVDQAGHLQEIDGQNSGGEEMVCFNFLLVSFIRAVFFKVF